MSSLQQMLMNSNAPQGLREKIRSRLQGVVSEEELAQIETRLAPLYGTSPAAPAQEAYPPQSEISARSSQVVEALKRAGYKGPVMESGNTLTYGNDKANQSVNLADDAAVGALLDTAQGPTNTQAPNTDEAYSQLAMVVNKVKGWQGYKTPITRKGDFAILPSGQFVDLKNSQEVGSYISDLLDAVNEEEAVAARPRTMAQKAAASVTGPGLRKLGL